MAKSKNTLTTFSCRLAIDSNQFWAKTFAMLLVGNLLIFQSLSFYQNAVLIVFHSRTTQILSKVEFASVNEGSDHFVASISATIPQQQ